MKRLSVAVAACSLGLVVAAPARAVTITEFPTGSGDPAGIAPGPDGSLWFAEGTGRRIGRIGPSGAGFTHFPAEPSLLLGDTFDVTPGPDGNLWFADAIGQRVGRITTSGAIDEFPVGGASPLDITAGARGKPWCPHNAAKENGPGTPPR